MVTSGEREWEMGNVEVRKRYKLFKISFKDTLYNIGIRVNSL